MALSNELISQFVKATQDKEETKKESTAYGKIVKQGDIEYVQLDGSDLLTPISSTTVVKDGDRVMVTIKNHEAIVTGDLTNPSANDKDVKEIGNKISEFEIVIADKVSTEQLEAEIAKIDKLITDEIEATNAKVETIEGKVAEIDTIKADVVEIDGKVSAHEAEFTTLRADIADFKDVTAESVEAIEGKFHTLDSDYAAFKETTTNTLEANEASINELETKKLDAETATVTYANIDFSNIQAAAVEKLFTDSGIIEDLTMSDGKVTGELVGVTIKGDLIEGNTLKADKLVILGEDGLYYKLNVDALGETTVSSDEKYQNGLDGSVIIAESITAEKIAVDDLVAFGATIGGYRINEHSLYSGTKNSVSNTTRGVFLGDDGQMAIGDANNYLKFFKDTDNNYKLEIQASALKFGASGTSVEEAINEVSNNAIVSSVEQFYLSTSPTKLEGGSWSSSQPTWTEGKYIWRRAFVTKGDGTTEYQPSANGVCITGNTGAQGIQGPQGIQGEKGEPGSAGADGKGIKESTITYQSSTSGTEVPTGEWLETIPLVEAGSYLWTCTTTIYTDGNITNAYSVSKMGEPGSGGKNLLLDSKNGYDYTDTDYIDTSSSEGKIVTTTAIGNGNRHCLITDKLSMTTEEFQSKVDESIVFALDTNVTGNFTNLRFGLEMTCGSTKWLSPIASIPDDCGKETWIRVSGTDKIKHVLTTSKQLFDVNDIYEMTEGITVDDEGWITVTYDNTNGTTAKRFNFYTNSTPKVEYGKTYAVITEYKNNLDSSQRLYPTGGGQANTIRSILINKSASGVDVWRGAFNRDSSNVDTLLGTYLTINAGNKCSITFRLSVWDDAEVTADTFVYEPLIDSTIDTHKFIVAWDDATVGSTVEYRLPKLELGNKATDWTAAPEDIEKDISERVTNDDLNEIEEALGDRINEAQTTITALQGMISHLVTDENGGSLMTQTPDGWTFNMSSINGNLEAIQSAMENMGTDHNDTNNELQKLTDLVNDVVNKTAYVTISTDDNGDPCIELGKTDNLFKVRITNTAIDFLEGSNKIAYANNNTFYSSKIITNEIQIGEGPGFVWRTRSNGNMGLVYVTN